MECTIMAIIYAWSRVSSSRVMVYLFYGAGCLSLTFSLISMILWAFCVFYLSFINEKRDSELTCQRPSHRNHFSQNRIKFGVVKNKMPSALVKILCANRMRRTEDYEFTFSRWSWSISDPCMWRVPSIRCAPFYFRWNSRHKINVFSSIVQSFL